MLRFILSSTDCLGASHFLRYFSTSSQKWRDLRKKVVERKVLLTLQHLSETFVILRRIQRDSVINVDRPSSKISVILVEF